MCASAAECGGYLGKRARQDCAGGVREFLRE